jgi:hypothetical protein
MTHGFLQGPNGDYSNGRLIADFIIVSTVAMSGVFIWIKVKHPEINLMELALAISVLYGALAGSALVSLFGHKKTESKANEQ